MKNLGIEFSFSPRETGDVNYQKLVKKVSNLCEKYEKFKYDFYKKIYTLNTYILSQVWYISKSIFPPRWFFEQIQKIIRRFLWGIKDKVKYSTVILNKEDGGLKFPDVELRIRAQHLLWLKQIFNENTHNWKLILHEVTKGEYKNIAHGNTPCTHTHF